MIHGLPPLSFAKYLFQYSKPIELIMQVNNCTWVISEIACLVDYRIPILDYTVA